MVVLLGFIGCRIDRACCVSLGYRRLIYFGREMEVLWESFLLAFLCAAILVVLELRPVRGRREEAVFVKNVQSGKPSQISGLIYRCGAAPHLVAINISPSGRVDALLGSGSWHVERYI